MDSGTLLSIFLKNGQEAYWGMARRLIGEWSGGLLGNDQEAYWGMTSGRRGQEAYWGMTSGNVNN